MTKYHIAASGKSAGKWVPCQAEHNCRIGGQHIASSSVADAVNKGDINAFFEAKNIESTVKTKSLEEMGFTPRTSLPSTPKPKTKNKVLRTLGAAVGAAGIAVLLSACSPSSLNTGTIDAKDHREAYTTITQQCGGKPITCHPITQHHPEQWNITIEGYNADGDTETRTVNVGETIYNEVNVGETYSLTADQKAAAESDAAWGNGFLIAGGVAGAGTLGGILYVRSKRRREEKEFEAKWGYKPHWRTR